MDLTVRNESRIVEIWLTADEKRNERLQTELKLVYQSFRETGYTVATFLSGEQNLTEVTSGLICYNRRRTAQKEVEREKKQRHTFLLSAKAMDEVIELHYSDLNALLRSEPEAKRYFDTLPDYAREQIQTRSGNVNSFASLKDYAENLLRGDG